MNKNLFIYSFKYLAVLLALVTFSSCERDEFTEADAFALQQQQLQEQYTREQQALIDQDARANMAAWERRKLDSLTRLNAGGKVFYTVNVVPGGSSVFSSGRFEEAEGLDGATVTVTQFTNGSGATSSAFTQQVETVNGIASFELYSGEVTVNIDAPNHTDLNYTANLTPDGGVPNGAVAYVGNVVPVFDDPNNPGADSESNMATVSGLAFAELDITFGNNQEEAVPDGTKVRAFIDVANPAFKAKYIDQANEEGVNIGGNTTMSGYIQRFAYEEAASTTGTTVTAALGNGTAPEGGEYSIMIGATGSGLPITMKFDDFAADRTYYFDDNDGDFGTVGTKRFLYTQNTMMGGNQTPTPIGTTGISNLASRGVVDFDLVQTEATATASLTGGDAVTSIDVTDRGYYYEAPTVTISDPASGTTATGRANLVDITVANNNNNPLTAGQTDAAARGLKMVGSVTVISGGSGYTSDPTVTFTRKSYTGRDAAGVPVPNGTGSVAAPSSSVTYIRVMNGGFGMTPAVAGGTAVTGVGSYTGVAPAVVFNNGIAPAGGALATANAIVDETVGTVTEVQVTNGGNGYDDANLNITFNYGSDASVTAIEGPDADATAALFIADATGELRWNTLASTRTLTTDPAGSDGDVQYAPGTNYTFVPSVTLTGLTAPAGATLPTFEATVTDGKVTSIEMQGATSGWAVGTYNGNVQINANPDGVAVSAEGFTQGGSIDSYILTNYGTTNNVYQATVEAAGETFNYLTTLNDGSGTIVDQTGAAVAPADYADNSDFIVVFENPTDAGGTNAWGYPIFDNSGGSLVGLFFINQGIGYTNPAPAAYNFWVLPNDLAGTAKAGLAQYAGTNGTNDANANATADLTDQVLTITFTEGGLGYAVRPEFVLSGGEKSVEDLAGLNSTLNGAIRGQLNFNSQGTITTPSVNVNLTTTFTAAGLANDPLAVTVSTSRLEGIFNTEANYATSAANGGFEGGIVLTAASATDFAAPSSWMFYADRSNTTSVRAMFNAMESAEFTAADLVGSNPGNTDFKYITAPTYSVLYGGVATGGTGTTVLEPATADIIGFSATANGSIDGSFYVPTNDPSYSTAGERFRVIGGGSDFEVFSGLSYIRDVNYGTGIELE
ncbi:beta strand repeat-containing protein [Bernardetia sp.]|uniref:beta strand repeat-containing protein n=1 Tax=Bernardetia sp. TaxID=1937974 RepID=UPI0025BF0784|nr:hypothetical protein [Bernardetia sp.]